MVIIIKSCLYTLMHICTSQLQVLLIRTGRLWKEIVFRRFRIPSDNIVSLLHGIALIIVLHSRVQSSTIGIKTFPSRDLTAFFVLLGRKTTASFTGVDGDG